MLQLMGSESDKELQQPHQEEVQLLVPELVLAQEPHKVEMQVLKELE
jgi:hypothetical protein